MATENIIYKREQTLTVKATPTIADKVRILDAADGSSSKAATIDSLPISNAQQAALDLKAPINNPTFTGTVSGVTKSMVGLGNVDNTSDANKPISSATQTALNGKVSTSTTVNGHALSSNVTVTASDVGLGNVDNTSDANKPVSTAQATAIGLKQNTITGAATTITSSDLTANKILQSDASGKVAVVDTATYPSLTELSYVKGVTSSIQTQISDRALKGANSDITSLSGLTTALSVAQGGTGVTAMPKFRAYLGTNQTININSTTVLAFDTETFDTNSNYDTSTYRFTPTVAGYYRIYCKVKGTNTNTNFLMTLSIRKNGTAIATYEFINPYTDRMHEAVSVLVQMNGTTDYIDATMNHNNTTSMVFSSGSALSYIEGAYQP